MSALSFPLLPLPLLLSVMRNSVNNTLTLHIGAANYEGFQSYVLIPETTVLLIMHCAILDP